MAINGTGGMESGIGRIIRLVSPPIIGKAFKRLTARKVMNASQFRAWWAEQDIPPELGELAKQVNAFIASESFATASNYWHHLNRRNIQQLLDSGYAQFKRTVARNYFVFIEGLDGDYARNLLEKARGSQLEVQLGEVIRQHELFTLEESIRYNLITLLLYDHVVKSGGAPFIGRMIEPKDGNNPTVRVAGTNASQDMLSGILDYMAIARAGQAANAESIIELGAGSGRTAFALLSLMPGLKKYIIADVPPALFLSQTYLSHAFPNKKVFKFRPWTNFVDVETEFKEADIVFLMPHQMRQLPDQVVDLFVAIDCLHEMKSEVVDAYFTDIDRLAKSLYFKCWQETVVPFDNVKHTINSYPIRSNWKEVYKENCAVPAAFFHAFYKLHSAS